MSIDSCMVVFLVIPNCTSLCEISTAPSQREKPNKSDFAKRHYTVQNDETLPHTAQLKYILDLIEPQR